MMQTDVCEIGGKRYVVTGWHAVNDVGIFPIADIPLVSDYKWNLDCLESRLQHPEHYAEWEDVPETVARIKTYLEENKETGKTEGLYEKYLAMVGGVIL